MSVFKSCRPLALEISSCGVTVDFRTVGRSHWAPFHPWVHTHVPPCASVPWKPSGAFLVWLLTGVETIGLLTRGSFSFRIGADFSKEIDFDCVEAIDVLVFRTDRILGSLLIAIVQFPLPLHAFGEEVSQKAHWLPVVPSSHSHSCLVKLQVPAAHWPSFVHRFESICWQNFPVYPTLHKQV